MTHEQRVRWEADGFLKLPGVLADDDLKEVRAAVKRAERAWAMDTHRPGVRSERLSQILGPVEYDNRLLELMWHPKVFPIIRETLGSDATMIDNDLYIIPPRAKAHTEWHHDVGMVGAYHPRSVLMVKAFFLLTSVDETSGGTAMVPGSHKFPEDWIYPDANDPKNMPGATIMTGQAGDVYLFNGRIYHASTDSYSETPRRLLTFNFGHLWMRVWPGYEPSERLLRAAEDSGDPVRRQLLGLAHPYGGGIIDEP